ncbi:MAG: hypothetical protein GWN30_22620 [Gammaproteobacteria bacterium]|nr:hypothetical protein [Gammaproteobacteria bacterium]
MSVRNTNRLPRLAIAILMIAILLVVGLLTPPGRSLAQSVLQLFTRTEKTSFTPEKVPGSPAESDPSAPTAEPPAPLISVAEAEAQVGFDVFEMPDVPAGFEFQGARVYGNAVYLEYSTQNFGGSLMIRQSIAGYNQSDWDQVPAEDIIPVEINDLEGEFAQGTFVVYAGETEATWNPEAAILRLRWVQDDIWLEMTKMGDVESIEYLDRQGMIELAESLAVHP